MSKFFLKGLTWKHREHASLPFGILVGTANDTPRRIFATHPDKADLADLHLL